MSKGKTRFLAVLLSLTLVFSVGGVIAFAVDDGSDSLPETPVAELAIEPEVEGTDSIKEGTPETQTNGEGVADDENTPMTLDDVTPTSVSTDDEFLEAIADTSITAITLANDIEVTVTASEDHYVIPRSIEIDI